MAKAPHLVSQHLENISRRMLEKYQGIIRDYVRHRCGIYALYRRERLYYVGLASDLRWRLKTHLKDKHGASWDRFSVYLTIGTQHIKELEALLLRIIKPKGNTAKAKFRRSQNLQRALVKSIKEYQRKELFGLMGRAIGKPKKAERMSKNRSALARLGPRRIRGWCKGKVFKARLIRNGAVRFDGKTHRSPSMAARAALKRGCNGWWFWHYERAPGDWVRLRELRK